MRSVLLLLALGCLSCAPKVSEDAKFESLAHNYIEAQLRMNPEWATTLGDHRYDQRVSDYSLEGVRAERALSAAYLDSLSHVEVAALSPVNRIDCRIMTTNLAFTLFSIDTLREHEWNPLNYNPGSAIYSLLAREFAPLDARLESVRYRLRAVPGILRAARSNLKNPPRIFTETAIQQNAGTIALVKDDLKDFIAKSSLSAEGKAAMQAAQDTARLALEAFGAWMQKDLLPASTGDFRLGEERFRRKFFYALESDITPEEVMHSAESDLGRTREAMYQCALPLFRGFFPNAGPSDTAAVIKRVLDRLAERHPENETIVALAQEDLAQATAFVRVQDLVSVPNEPVKVIVMPEFERGVAVAYCEAAGPLEKNGETFYTISPTPKDWSAQRVGSFFREYNNYMLLDLTVHEAMPGHYLQLAHANQFHAPTMIRALFSSGTFVEGWATYAEQLMAERGYGGAEFKMEQLKMRLRLIINAILDQRIHMRGMTEKEAMDLMMREGFQEEGEAAGKWRRACLSSTQLSTYYVGNMELNALRTAYQAKFGAQDTLRTMHDAILSLGSPAPRYVREGLGL